jgi:hypothetical protein
MKIIVHNNISGVILTEKINEDRFLTVKRANRLFHAPFIVKSGTGLTNSEPLSEGNNAIGFKTFYKVSYHFSSEGVSGLVTNYNCNIYTPPTEAQIKFIGTSKIDYITFQN